MKEISRRRFLRTSALAGAAAVLAGTASLGANAASPAPQPAADENCLGQLGTAIASLGNGSPVLPTVVGLSRGYVMGYTYNGIHTFKGIPYGMHQRFRYAAPVESYGTAEQPTNALTNGSVSPQSNTQTNYYNPFAAAAFMTPSESDMFSTESQCLNLNVWTSSLDSSARKPVLVFIHGGGLQTGSSLELKIYDGQYFADYTDCVFVSANARLNYVGYLDLSAIGGDANTGIADLVLALQWVRDNIAAFGGDPGNVTILGQSGGGTKVTALASAPAAQGLFQKVVNVSGGAASGRSPEQAAENAYQLVNHVRANVQGMSSASDAEVFSYLQTADYDQLVSLCEGAGVDYQLTTGSPYFQSDFYSGSGLNAIAAQYTYMIGNVWAEMDGRNSADAVLYSRPGDAKCNLTAAQQENAMRELLGSNYDQAAELFAAAYPGHDLYDLRSLISFADDPMTAHAAASAPAVYEYLVAYTLPYFGGMTMTHTSDIGFWFHSVDTVPYQIAGDEANAHHLSDQMARALAAFCATGDPSTPALSWDPYTMQAPRTMVFDTHSSCKDSSFDDALQTILGR